MSKDIYEIITARFIDQLKKGTVPWQKPWMGVQNIVSKKPYRGINSLILGGSDFQSPYWLTFKQAHDLGGNIKKGEKATPVIYYKLFEKRDDKGNLVLGSNGRPTRIPFIRWSNAFNLDQTEGIEAPAQTATQEVIQPLDKAAKIVAEAKICPIYHTGFAAVYSPGEDVIRMPAQKTFRSPESYYQTLFHEMTHSTGHASRLDREGVTLPIKFGSERYSKEELIAELGASFLSNEAGILNQVQFDNSAAYLGSWIEKFQNDPRMIFTASSQAQRSTDFILGIEQKESLGESQSPAGLATPKEEPALAQKMPAQTAPTRGIRL
ncbi:MAG: zincin-like metallopeptidase domain-containing protein [Chthoniobacterales bacterium]